MLTRWIEHPAVPKKGNYVRSEIILGVNVLKPLPDGRTDFTSVSHTRLKGVPRMIADSTSVKGAAQFIETLEGLFNPAAEE